MRLIISVKDGRVFDVVGLPEDADIEVRYYDRSVDLSAVRQDAMGDTFRSHDLHIRRTTGELEV